jgi:hypothetical protein
VRAVESGDARKGVGVMQPAETLLLWCRDHEDGWQTWVAERADGTFASWVCPPGHNAIAGYVEDTCDHAVAAAMFQLARLGDHVCGASCGAWLERNPHSCRERASAPKMLTDGPKAHRQIKLGRHGKLKP